MGLFFVLAVAGILLIFMSLTKAGYLRRLPYDIEINPYFRKNPLTKTESIFYQRLVLALPEHIVLAQVQLSSFIGVDKTKVKGEFYKWFNPIAQQSVDFLICRQDFSVLAAVELDDKSHNTRDAEGRDRKKSKNLAAAEIPLIRWHAESMPSVEEIQRALQALNTSNNQPLSEAEPQYFVKPGKSHADLFRLGLAVMLVAVFVVVLYFARVMPGLPMSMSVATNVQPQNAESQQASTGQAAQEKLNLKQIQQNYQEQERRTIEEEVNLKAHAWERYYKRRPECDLSENFVTCGNEYIRAKKQFEKEWAARNQERVE